MVLGSCVLLQPLSGAAAPGDWFSDDFETGTLRTSDTPAGRWDSTGASSPNTLTNGTAGAHRGQYGLTVVDRTSNAGSQANANVVRDPLTTELHVRTWLRLRAVSTPGSMVVLQALPARLELRLLAPGPIWELAGRNGADQSTYVSIHGSRVEEERWYLVEFSAWGLGTNAGEAKLWVDGVEQGVFSGRDWRGTNYLMSRLVVGEPWADAGNFIGSIDFDDVRVSATPMASRLELRRPVGAGDSSGCVAVDVSLRSSATGAPAPAPYTMEVALAVTEGAGRFHVDAACGFPVPGALLLAGASEQRVYFRPGGTGGKATVKATHPDFLSATLPLEGIAPPDGEGDPDEDPVGPWTTDLGCTSAPGALVALPVLLWPWIRFRRRWHTPKSPHCARISESTG
ncbi:hypothetical protein JQX13_01310 [Archangium violaceum]|uniref:hypothetical protein n=1 Tax=Archangium violaceum TaxID=83451 RepID=UPI00193C2785|nr:hypothetical protein [Archangium violaceum]QRK08840.1 hypothetical protein JQX13_01310 [Archangium violaceum]